jgi:hypothetical protein
VDLERVQARPYKSKLLGNGRSTFVLEALTDLKSDTAPNPKSADCVAKLFAVLRESNNRIRLNDVLNQCCVLAFVLESILLILIVKIVL